MNPLDLYDPTCLPSQRGRQADPRTEGRDDPPGHPYGPFNGSEDGPEGISPGQCLGKLSKFFRKNILRIAKYMPNLLHPCQSHK